MQWYHWWNCWHHMMLTAMQWYHMTPKPVAVALCDANVHVSDITLLYMFLYLTRTHISTCCWQSDVNSSLIGWQKFSTEERVVCCLCLYMKLDWKVHFPNSTVIFQIICICVLLITTLVYVQLPSYCLLCALTLVKASISWNSTFTAL